MSSLNARSVANKTGLICETVIDKDLDVLAITETWLKQGDDHVINQLCPPGFHFTGIPRPEGKGSRGGGIGVMYRSSLHVQSVSKPSFTTFEHMCVRLSLQRPVLLCVIYRPPPSQKNGLTTPQFLSDIEEFLTSIVNEANEDLCVVGDFNIHVDIKDDPTAKAFSNLLASLDLQQLVTHPTHKAGHILDLILTRAGSNTISPTVSIHASDMSDHHLVQFTLPQQPLPTPKVLLSRRKFRSIDMEAFSADISSALSVQDDSSDVNNLVSRYSQSVTKVLDKHAPARNIALKGEAPKKWYDSEVHEARRKRRKLERQYSQTRLEVHRQILREQSLAVVRLIDNKKSQHYKERLVAADSKETFKIVSSLISSNSEPALPVASDDTSLAKSFASFFCEKVHKIHSSITTSSASDDCIADPVTMAELTSFQPQTVESITRVVKQCATKTCSLDSLPTALLKDDRLLAHVVPYITHLINRSLESSCVPDEYKQAQVRPLLKKDGLDINVLGNYRPVSNLPFLSKVMERVVAQQITRHMKQHQIDDHLQSAYKRGHSTETALLKIKADIDNMLDDGDGVLVVMLDLSAAFDTLDHNILLRRLETCVGLHGASLTWMESYLRGRSQRVCIRDSVSDKVQLEIGVPQGSVLGPLLFLIYILPLKDLINSFRVLRHGYADDSQLYDRLRLKNPQEIQNTVRNMERCLVEVRSWMQSNKLRLNDAKTEVLIVAKPNQRKCVHDITIKIGDSNITPTKCVKNLGGYMDECMTMERQVQTVVRNTNFHIRRISKIRHFLDTNTCAKVITATVTSRLDYHNALLCGIHNKHLKSLQVAQNNAARLLSRSSRREHITPILKQLHWLPIRHRVTFKVLTLVHSALHSDIAPEYLRSLFTVYRPGRSLRSTNDEWKLTVPRSRSCYGDRSIQVYGAKSWNLLPANLRGRISVQCFKRQLKTELFRTAFEL
jgi:hypothetical protein